jgi:hypothetical protein
MLIGLRILGPLRMASLDILGASRKGGRGLRDNWFWGTMVSSRMSIVSSVVDGSSGAPTESSSWQYIEGPESALDIACRVIAG